MGSLAHPKALMESTSPCYAPEPRKVSAEWGCAYRFICFIFSLARNTGLA